MKACFIMDRHGLPNLGGAELTMQQRIDDAPAHVEVLHAVGMDIPDADVYIIGNCTEYGINLVPRIQHKPIVKQVHDVWSRYDPRLKAWLVHNADLMVFHSKLHCNMARYHVGVPTAIVPPQIDWQRFSAVANNERTKDAVFISRFDTGKGIDNALAWADEHNADLDFYGYGYELNKVRATGRYKGMLEPQDVASTMAQYRRFVLIPQYLEPFGRVVAEAYAAGCEIVSNGLCGAIEWIQRDPDALQTASARWWQEVEKVANGG